MSYKRGLCSISFRAFSPQEILAHMQRAGLEVIEWGSDVHAPCKAQDTLEEIARLQEQYGIRCSSYGTYFKLGVTPLAELTDYIRAAKRLGTHILRLWCGDKNSEEYTQEEKDRLFAACKEAAAVAEQHGVLLCMECHNNTYTNQKESALELMQTVDSAHFRMYWQPNQYRSEQENQMYATLLAPYIVNVHVFNWKGDERYPLRDAVALWKSYLACFDSGKTLLLEFMPDNAMESLKGEAEALKEIVV